MQNKKITLKTSGFTVDIGQRSGRMESLDMSRQPNLAYYGTMAYPVQ
jgi:hypothetical protein